MADSTWPLPTRDTFAHICGEIAFASILTGVLSSIPAALRFSGEGGSFFSAFIPLAGIAAATASVVVFLVRTGSAGIQKAIPETSKRSELLVALSVWLFLGTVGLAVFGTVLSAVTHHRGLGGATFALVGLGITLVSALFAWRFTRLFGALAKRSAVAWAFLFAATFVLGGIVLFSIARESDSAGPAHAIGDLALVVVLALGASKVRLPGVYKRVWVPVGVLVLFVLVGFSISRLHHLASASPESRERVQIVSPILELIITPDAPTKRRGSQRSDTSSDNVSNQPIEPRDESSDESRIR